MVEFRVSWPTGLEGVDVIELARLLRALQGASRMAAAAASLQVSYRTAWSRLVAGEEALELRLVERIRGHGSQLTPAGHDLIEAVSHFERVAGAMLREPGDALAARLRALSLRSTTEGQEPLRVVASHDLLLQQLLIEKRAEGLQIRFAGSRDALLALSRGEAELAGFHRPVRDRAPLPSTSSGGARLFVVALAQREQGLIVARGNPLRICDVADLARSGLRFVNRQRGAGTRSWLDRLLRDGGIDATRIAGYDLEESTHLAVAATVAAGGADAGFGLRAAADRFGLGFVAIGMETYWLAGTKPIERDPRVQALLAAVRELASATPGYAAPRARASRFRDKKLNLS